MVAGKLLKIVLGLILILIALYIFITFSGWRQAVIDLAQGTIIILIALIGLAFLILGISELKG